jgi:hypothetical protein
MRWRDGVFVAGCLLTGCSSSSSVPPADAGATDAGSGVGTMKGTSSAEAGSCAGSPAVWKDDGDTRCATGGEAILSTNHILGPDGGAVTETTLEVVLLEAGSSNTFSLSVTSSEGIDGTYGCAPLPTSVVEIVYDEVGVYSTTVASCSVMVTLTPVDGGMVATGTFSALLTVSDGGMKTLSDGTFTFPVTAE